MKYLTGDQKYIYFASIQLSLPCFPRNKWGGGDFSHAVAEKKDE